MTTTSATAAEDRLDGAVLKVAGVVVLGAIMSILDITVVSVALPTFQTVFDATLRRRRLDHDRLHAGPGDRHPADRLGRRPVRHQAALHARPRAVRARLGAVRHRRQHRMLISFRVLQGLGGGMLMPLGMTIMTRAAGPERIGRLMAVLGVPMLLGPIVGPILGGWMIEIASWHWIFLINVPIGVVALVYAALVLPKDAPAAVGVLRLLRHAAAVPRPGAVPVRRLLDPRGGHRRRHTCPGARDHRPRAGGCASCCTRSGRSTR